MRGILKKQVEEVLKEDEQSRNSDLRLMCMVWKTYYEKFVRTDDEGCQYVRMRDMADVPREDHISRARRKIQEEGQYLPTSPQVRKRRKILEEECRAYYLEH